MTIYNRMFRFMAPLTITMLVLDFGAQALNVGMARRLQAIESLWSIMIEQTTVASARPEFA